MIPATVELDHLARTVAESPLCPRGSVCWDHGHHAVAWCHAVGPEVAHLVLEYLEEDDGQRI